MKRHRNFWTFRLCGVLCIYNPDKRLLTVVSKPEGCAWVLAHRLGKLLGAGVTHA
ncbi:MAG: hypothetical protein QXT45_04750 [Candidatus Bilamarchaeaceae archaeon]